MNKRAADREFCLGVLWAAWWLHSGHGEDTYAAWLLRESMPVSKARRLQEFRRKDSAA